MSQIYRTEITKTSLKSSETVQKTEQLVTRTKENKIGADIVETKITKRNSQSILNTLGELFSIIAEETRPILTSVGIFSKNEKSLDQMIALERKLNTKYIDVAIEKDDLKNGIEQKNIHALKLALADLDVSPEDALKIVELYAKEPSKAEENKNTKTKFDKKTLKELLGDVSNKNIEKILKSVNENISIRSILAKLINANIISKKTAIVADTMYRLGAKLIAAAAFLTGTILTTTAAGFAIPTTIIIAITATTLLGTAANVIKDGAETYKTEEKIETKKNEEVADDKSFKTTKEKVIQLATNLIAFFENSNIFFVSASKFIEDNDLNFEITSIVTTDIIDPFKKVVAQFSKAFIALDLAPVNGTKTEK